MTHTYSVTGMSCSGCQGTVQKLLSAVNGVEKVSIDLPKAEAVIDMKEHVSTDKLKAALKDYPKYKLDDKKTSTNGSTRIILINTQNLLLLILLQKKAEENTIAPCIAKAIRRMISPVIVPFVECIW